MCQRLLNRGLFAVKSSPDTIWGNVGHSFALNTNLITIKNNIKEIKNKIKKQNKKNQ